MSFACAQSWGVKKQLRFDSDFDVAIDVDQGVLPITANQKRPDYAHMGNPPSWNAYCAISTDFIMRRFYGLFPSIAWVEAEEDATRAGKM